MAIFDDSDESGVEPAFTYSCDPETGKRQLRVSVALVVAMGIAGFVIGFLSPTDNYEPKLTKISPDSTFSGQLLSLGEDGKWRVVKRLQPANDERLKTDSIASVIFRRNSVSNAELIVVSVGFVISAALGGLLAARAPPNQQATASPARANAGSSSAFVKIQAQLVIISAAIAIMLGVAVSGELGAFLFLLSTTLWYILYRYLVVADQLRMQG